MSEEYPREVQGFHDVLRRIPGVIGADTSVTSIEGLTDEELQQIELAEVPHTAIRRAEAKPGEAVVQVEFELTRDAAGWNALEFIAWCVKDLARSGVLVQLRPTGLPPIVREEVQLGKTLRFQLDTFVILQNNVDPALERLRELTGYFEKYLEFYGRALGL